MANRFLLSLVAATALLLCAAVPLQAQQSITDGGPCCPDPATPVWAGWYNDNYWVQYADGSWQCLYCHWG